MWPQDIQKVTQPEILQRQKKTHTCFPIMYSMHIKVECICSKFKHRL